MTSKKTRQPPARGSYSSKMGPPDRFFLERLCEARRDLDALKILWPALRRHRLGYTVLPESGCNGLDPDAGGASAVADDREDLKALLGALAALNGLASARRLLESRGEAMAARLLGEPDVCPVCARTVSHLKDGMCPPCYQSFYGWRNRGGNLARDPEQWVAWRRDNLKSQAVRPQ